MDLRWPFSQLRNTSLSSVTADNVLHRTTGGIAVQTYITSTVLTSYGTPAVFLQPSPIFTIFFLRSLYRVTTVITYYAPTSVFGPDFLEHKGRETIDDSCFGQNASSALPTLAPRLLRCSTFRENREQN